MMPNTEMQEEITRLRNEIVRKDAIIQGLLDTLVCSIRCDARGDMHDIYPIYQMPEYLNSD